MAMDTPDNYYAILGVPIDADVETIKRAYRQLARRYHPDLAGPEGATQMKRINRAYAVLSDAEKRLQYDTIIGGVIDLRKGGLVRPRPVQRKFEPSDDIEFSGLSIFSTRGPFRAGSMLRTQFGVVSSLGSAQTERGLVVAAGSLDGKGIFWQVEQSETPISFAADPALPVESLRELRLSPSGRLAAGWGRLGTHIWNTGDGSLLWSYSPGQRAVSAHYSLDIALKEMPDGGGEVWMALPLLREDPRAPRSQGVRGTDAIRHALNAPADELSAPLVCAEDEIEKRQFWAIRLRALARDARTLLTLSCAHVPNEANEQVVLRRWDMQALVKTRFREKLQPRILTSFTAGSCGDCTPPYAITPDARLLAFVSTGKMIWLLDTVSGTFNELASGTMGASSRLAISPDGRWVAVAREDSEINEGVIDMWSVEGGEVAQKLYHPWQISALHFAPGQLLAALTDGTIQVWKS